MSEQTFPDSWPNCVTGCNNKRNPSSICCDTCWKLVPRKLKTEYWGAYTAAINGRGKKKNGTVTPRLRASLKAIVDHLIEVVCKPWVAKIHEKKEG